MKFKFTPYIYILFFLFGIKGLDAQNYKLEINIDSKNNQNKNAPKNTIVESVPEDSIYKELSSFVEKIELKGYLNSSLDSLIKTDSIAIAYLNPGKQTQFINIYYDHIPKTLLIKNDIKLYADVINETYVRILFSDLGLFMESLVDLFEEKGNSFVQFSLQDIELYDQEARATLQMDLNRQRYIDKVIVKGYENFPKNYIDHELGLKKGTVFNKEKIKRASRSINNLLFAEELKSPEILFTNDSTIIYLYLRKKKSNKFDGIIGFASKEDDNGIEFNGYLDLAINNIFNSGETIALFWKNNGQNRQRFYLETELPYLFNTPLSPKANFELYRQDSTFNNIRAHISLRYSIMGKGQISAQLNTENSNDLTNGTTAGVASYSNIFYGLSYRYQQLSSDALFPITFDLELSGLFGSRKNESQKTNQTKFLLYANYLYAINKKNYLFLQNTSGLLNSDNYFENELFRIGGIYNLRGVNEESIFASAYTVFNLEYRFKPNSSSYFYSITDFSYSENQLIATNTNVISLGLGYAFQTKAGILNLSYAVGKFNNEAITLDNSKVHIKIISKF